MLGIIIQARTGSTRFANKILLPFYKDLSILEIILQKLKNNFQHTPIVVATTINCNDNKIVEISDKFGVLSFRGSEDDVLNRFIEAAKEFGLTKVVRICSDNPFIDIEGIKTLISYFNYTNAEYASFKINETPTIKTHFGLWGECVSVDSLVKVSKKTSEKLYREHVTNYIYTNKEKFDVKLIDVPTYIYEAKSIRLTVDTETDFIIAKELYQSFIDSKSIELFFEEVYKRKDILDQMDEQIKKNTK